MDYFIYILAYFQDLLITIKKSGQVCDILLYIKGV